MPSATRPATCDSNIAAESRAKIVYERLISCTDDPGVLASFAGPGYLVAVGYMDPGNWATSLAAGSRCGTGLLGVIVVANHARQTRRRGLNGRSSKGSHDLADILAGPRTV